MNYKEVKIELKKEFESFLKPKGYKSRMEGQGCGFDKKVIESIEIIGFGVANYVDEFFTGCFIQIENNKMEKIRKNIFGKEGSYAIGFNIGTYFNEINYRYKIETIDDIMEWGKIVRKFYEEYAVPFFEKYNTVDAIDKLLNQNPTEKVEYIGDQGWRIIKGLIAAKLNQNPNYEEIRNYYMNFVEKNYQGYFMYEKCLKTVEFLDSHSGEELTTIANS